MPSPRHDREIRSLSPEARRQTRESEGLADRMIEQMGPGTRAWQVARRIFLGTWNDGFIHAGNLAYLSMLAIFPFFILGAALVQLIGEESEQAAWIAAVLGPMPPNVSAIIAPVVEDTMQAGSGWLLWAGALVGIWTGSGLIETIRDILRRAYGTRQMHAYWKTRLLSAGLILGAAILMMTSLFAQFAISAAEEFIRAFQPQLANQIAALRLSKVAPALGLFASLYMLFLSLTPERYRSRAYPKWPGALVTTIWWFAVSIALPPIISAFVTYNLTYGSLAGIVVVLLFFWLVGLGLVIGAEWNAALAEAPSKSEGLGRTESETQEKEMSQ